MIDRALWGPYMLFADQLLIPRGPSDLDYLGEPKELICKILRNAGLSCGQPELPNDPKKVIRAVELAVIGLPAAEQESLLRIIEDLDPELPWPICLWAETIPPQRVFPDKTLCEGIFCYGYPGDLGPWPPEGMDESQKLEVHMADLGSGMAGLPSQLLTRPKKRQRGGR